MVTHLTCHKPQTVRDARNFGATGMRHVTSMMAPFVDVAGLVPNFGLLTSIASYYEELTSRF